MISADRLPVVVIETGVGTITVEIDIVNAPLTAANFLRYVDGGLFDAATFYRSVRPDHDPNPVGISALQGGLRRSPAAHAVGPIPHEGSEISGLRHAPGVLSMARGDVGTAQAEFFIVVEGSSELDAGGARHPDGRGFAAFGRVRSGMDVVRALLTRDVRADGELAGELVEPVPISVRRQVTPAA